jgi:hypothetical protein
MSTDNGPYDNREPSGYYPCSCEMQRMVCGLGDEEFACACVGPRMVEGWDGKHGWLVFVERSPVDRTPDSPTQRLAELAAQRPPDMTLTEWIAQLKALAADLLKDEVP